MSTEEKRESEKKILADMVKIYCKCLHKTGTLCPDCQEMLAYAWSRTDKCPRMAYKTFCANCPHPCYKPDMKQKILKVMKFSGPRMMFIHPLSVIKHVIATKKNKKHKEEK